MRRLRQGRDRDVGCIDEALGLLRRARVRFGEVVAQRTTAAVRQALKGAEGARRHAERCALHEYIEERRAQDEADRDRLFDVRTGRFLDEDMEEEEDGERLSCEECGESFNARESGSDTYCVRCAPESEEDACDAR